MSGAGIRLEEVTVVFNPGTPNQVTALEGINLEIAPGEVVVILGGNASGKSTLLKVIAGIIRPIKGRIFIDGQDVTDVKDYQRMRDISFVHQDPLMGTCPNLTLFENMILAGKGRWWWPLPFRFRLTEEKGALKKIGIGLYERLPVPLINFSGGQRQAVAAAISFSRGCKIALLDEFTSSLDEVTGDLMLKMAMQECQTKNATLLLITHEIKRAVELGKSVAVLRGGRLQGYFREGDAFLKGIESLTYLVSGARPEKTMAFNQPNSSQKSGPKHKHEPALEPVPELWRDIKKNIKDHIWFYAVGYAILLVLSLLFIPGMIPIKPLDIVIKFLFLCPLTAIVIKTSIYIWVRTVDTIRKIECWTAHTHDDLHESDTRGERVGAFLKAKTQDIGESTRELIDQVDNMRQLLKIERSIVRVSSDDLFAVLKIFSPSEMFPGPEEIICAVDRSEPSDWVATGMMAYQAIQSRWARETVKRAIDKGKSPKPQPIVRIFVWHVRDFKSVLGTVLLESHFLQGYKTLLLPLEIALNKGFNEEDLKDFLIWDIDCPSNSCPQAWRPTSQNDPCYGFYSMKGDAQKIKIKFMEKQETRNEYLSKWEALSKLALDLEKICLFEARTPEQTVSISRHIEDYFKNKSWKNYWVKE